MFFRVSFELLPTLQRPFDIHCRDCVLLGEAVSENRNGSAMEKVKDPILNMALFGSELIDPVS